MSDDLSGHTLGRYHVLERLGRGGMAEVYRAYQPSLDRFVAIKVIYPHLATEGALRERFGREARAVAALRHPNIVQVYDFDVQADTAFMAMEFVGGPTLKAAIQSLSGRGRLLPLPVVGRIVGQIADALAYAHEQQVVHRDVKPANVLLRQRGSAALATPEAIEALLLNLSPSDVVLTDFGVARILSDSSEHTAIGTILGSPAYMSPEQGRGERADHRSDIYSLGVVLYELLTGHVPFDADTPFAVVLKHTSAVLPPPRGSRPDLPEGLERVVLKALAKDPADRFQDAAAFGAAVREQCGADTSASFAQLQAARPAPDFATRVVELTAIPADTSPAAAPAAPASSASPANPPRRSRLRGWLIGCLFTVGVSALVAVVAFFAGGAAIFRGLAGAGALVVPTQFQAQATALAATIVAEGGTPPEYFVTPMVAPVAPSADLPAGVSAALDSANAVCSDFGCPGGSASQAVAILDNAIASYPDSAALLVARARTYLHWDLYSYRDQIRADADAAIAIEPANSLAYMVRGLLGVAIAENDDDRAEARADLDRAVEVGPGLIDPLLARAAVLSGSDDFYNDTSPSRNQVINDTSAALAIEPSNLTALDLRSAAFYTAKQPNLALADCEAMLAIDPTSLNALVRRAGIYRYYQNQPQAALDDYAAALAAHPDDLYVRSDRATLAAAQGEYDLALDDLDMLIEAEPANPDRYVFRGLLRLVTDQLDEARDDFDRALLIAGPEHTMALYGRGKVNLAEEEAEAAIPDLEAAAEVSGDLDFVWYTFYNGRQIVFVDLAEAYLLADRPDDAMSALDRAVESEDSWYKPFLMRGRLRREDGDDAGAREDLRRALELAEGTDQRGEVEDELRLLSQ